MRKRAVEVLAGALVLDQQHTFPEGVDAAVAHFLAGTHELDLLFEDSDAAPVYAKNVEEVVPETLRFGPL